MVKILFKAISSAKASEHVLIVGHFAESSELLCCGNGKLSCCGVFDENCSSDFDILAKVKADCKFDSKIGTFSKHVAVGGRTVRVIGLGKQADWNNVKANTVGGKVASMMSCANISDSEFVAGFDDYESIAHIAYGASIRCIKFNKYITSEERKNKGVVNSITFFVKDQLLDDCQNAFAHMQGEIDAIAFVRSLVSEPANILYPASYSDIVRSKLSELGVEVEVLGEEAMHGKGMMALLGVGQGSSKESRLVIMKWNGGRSGTSPIALVGKGVTFDTGGVSIKPARGMWDMKYDMAGSASVVGALFALAKRKAPINVVGIIGLVENAVDGSAQRPGDVVRSMSGKTIEVLNTDAEGRLVLADVLWYAQSTYTPRYMVDLATLTGAIITALGSNKHAGLFSNDDTLAQRLTSAGELVGERLWRMPMGGEYDEWIESPIADLQNIATNSAGADSIVAAQFLSHFVNETKWAHLDIAGVAWDKNGSATCPAGATAFGVRLLNAFIRSCEDDVTEK